MCLNCVLSLYFGLPSSLTAIHHFSSSKDWGGSVSLSLTSGDLVSNIRAFHVHHHVDVTFCDLQVGNPRVELTLSELQDMAARQQQQIENQQQMLVAKVIISSKQNTGIVINTNFCQRVQMWVLGVQINAPKSL